MKGGKAFGFEGAREGGGYKHGRLCLHISEEFRMEIKDDIHIWGHEDCGA